MARANAVTIAHAPDRLAMRVYFARWAVLSASRASPRRITARSNTARSRFFPFLTPRRRRVQERGPAGFAHGTPADVDRRSDEVSATIARIALGNGIAPRGTPFTSRAHRAWVHSARARARIARANGISYPCELLHETRFDRKKADVHATLPPRSQDRDPHGNHREPPGEDPGGYHGQRALHGHQEVERWQGWVGVLQVGARPRLPPAPASLRKVGPKFQIPITFFGRSSARVRRSSLQILPEMKAVVHLLTSHQ